MRHKYNAKRTLRDGVLFDSKREAERYGELKLLARAGVIRNLKLQPEYVLQDGFTDAMGQRHRKIAYRADFSYEEKGRIIAEDVKGVRTQVFSLKRKLFLAKYPTIELRITR